MKISSLRPEYAEFIPKQLESGVLYISKRFETASHLCACGCGTKVVTPFRRAEYVLSESGGLVSLRPSVGNWSHPCQSHYWITNNKVVDAGPMSSKAILAGRQFDDAQREAYFAQHQPSWWRRVRGRLFDWVQALFK